MEEVEDEGAAPPLLSLPWNSPTQLRRSVPVVKPIEQGQTTVVLDAASRRKSAKKARIWTFVEKGAVKGFGMR
jgi:hypothetical protein